MIIWGGLNAFGGNFNTGGRYNPSTDSWTATRTSGAPVAREFHTAVWTGSEMIIWGGRSRSRVEHSLIEQFQVSFWIDTNCNSNSNASRPRYGWEIQSQH